MHGGDPVCFCVSSFTQRDLEVGVYSVADVSIRGSFISLHISLNGGLEPFDLVFKGKDRETVDFFAVLDGLDQTGCNLSEGVRVDIGIGGEYVFHSTRGVAGWGQVGTASSRGFRGGIDGVIGHSGGSIGTNVDKGVVLVVNGDRCKGVRGKSMGVREYGREWRG